MRFATIVILCLFCCQKIECTSTSVSTKKNSSQFFLDDYKIESKKLISIFSANSEAYKIAENYIGIAQSYFYAFSSENKSQTAELYNTDIASQILLINKNIRSLSKRAKRSADVLSSTLTQLTTAVDQLIIDSSQNASENVIQTDYIQIENVVESFKDEFPKSLRHKNEKNIRKAVYIADKSLHAFTRGVEDYIQQLNQLVFESALVNQTFISSQNNLALNLREFVVSSAIAAYLSTSKGL